MKIRRYHHPASPYVRKVMIVAAEARLYDRLEVVAADVWHPTPELLEAVPPGRIPAMDTPDGLLLGSTLCCEYLDHLHDGAKIIPADGCARWRALSCHRWPTRPWKRQRLS
jgi:glutathione S-transferase